MKTSSTISTNEDLFDDSRFNALINKRINDLKTKLLDFSRRNPLISANLSDRSNASLRVVDEILERLFDDVRNKETMEIVALPSLEDDPQDEKNNEGFQNKFIELKNSDKEFISLIEQIDYSKDNSSDEERKAERILKDKVRQLLKMPLRQIKKSLSLVEHAINNNINPSFELPIANNHEDGRHEDDKIQTLLLPDTLERKLIALTQKEKTWIDETGISVLKIAFGYLEWKDSPDSKEIYSPLVLIPISIVKQKSSEGLKFFVSTIGGDSDVEFNLVLVEKLKAEFGINLPVYNPDCNIGDYLRSIHELNLPNIHWKVRRWISFGVFPSGRMAMYNDLSQWDFSNHSIISQMLTGSENQCGVLPFGDEYEIDEPEFEANLAFNDVVADIDSSQFSTILDIAQGKNLAVEGPPGSGKSQTIINTIAAMIAKGKKVLFVAEKSAALEVVRNRLEAKSLGEFLLPLQATRASRELVIKSIKDRIEAVREKPPQDYQIKVDDFKKYRNQLKEYIVVLSAPFKDSGYSIYEVLGASIRFREYYDQLPNNVKESFFAPRYSLYCKDKAVRLPDKILALNKRTILEIFDSCKSVQELSKNITDFNSLWLKVNCKSTDRFLLESINQDLFEIINKLESIIHLRDNLCDFDIDKNINLSKIELLLSHIDRIPSDLSNYQRVIVGKLKEVDQQNIFFDYYESLEKFNSETSELENFCKFESLNDLIEELDKILDCLNFFEVDKLDNNIFEEKISNLLIEQAKLLGFYEYSNRIISEFAILQNSSLESLDFALNLLKNLDLNILYKRDHKWLEMLNQQRISLLTEKINQYNLLEQECSEMQLSKNNLNFEDVQFLHQVILNKDLQNLIQNEYSSSSITSLKSTIDILKNDLSTLKKVREISLVVYQNKPMLRDIDLIILIKGMLFSKNFSTNIIERKDIKFKGAEVKALLEKFKTKAKSLLRIKENLVDQFYLIDTLTINEILNAYNQLVNSNPFSYILSKDYREAQNFFSRISINRGIKKQQKKEQLHALYNYHKGLEDFHNDALKRLLDDSFEDINTDFDFFLEVNDFYNKIDLNFVGDVDFNILRNYLYEIPYSDYLMIDSDTQMLDKLHELNCDSFAKLEDLINKLSDDLIKFNRFTSLIRNVNFETPLVDLELEIIRLYKKMQFQNEIDTDEDSKALLGESFNGVATDLNPYHALCNFYIGIQNLSNCANSSELKEFLLNFSVDEIAKFKTIKILPDYDFNLTAIVSNPRILNTSLKDIKYKIEECREKLERAKSLRYSVESFFKNVKHQGSLIQEQIVHYKNIASSNLNLRNKLDCGDFIRPILGEAFHGVNTEINTLQPIQVFMKYLLENDLDKKDLFFNLLVYAQKEQIQNNLKYIKSDILVFSDILVNLSGKLDLDLNYLNASSDEENLNLFRKLVEDFDFLNSVSKINYHLDLLRSHEFCIFVDYLKENLAQGDIPEKFMALVMSIFAKEIYHDQNVKNIFDKCHGTHLNYLRNRIKDLDKEILNLTSQKIRYQLINEARPPGGIGKGKKSEFTQMSLLYNEIEKKKRFISSRDLLQRAGEALLELKPCWMMSPLAVAQYIPKGSVEFDLLIIDEASQMTPEDAVGAIVRSKQVMVVGDTNQLPPSQFFRKLLDDTNENEDENEDYKVPEESILEIANNCFRPARRLKWHYRSRHSSLIAFSNKYVYDNDLVIFPNPNEKSDTLGVSLRKVPGVYSNGTNDIEASVMVDEIVKFMTGYPDMSLGVVVVNQKQREQIQDKLNYALENSKETQEYLERWDKWNEGLEAFFIKNLENVQGDERDVIFIGTVYGPEILGGKVMQRFGPISGITGKRRLNVLFSRAKKKVLTFTSMNPTDIKADENSSNIGAFLLKKWIEYSFTGVIEAGSIREGSEPDSDFEAHVIDQIKSLGYEVEPQVGVRGYSIDIGVKHPENGHFILGVECDGATYHSSKSARDRDRLRQEVLEGLGWKLHRIWSTDWFNDPRKETERLRDIIRSLV
jgi:superfamily I DNA and/or RNA helicase/very-short-patch-repair endonuclease